MLSEADAMKTHRSSLLIDTHNDVTSFTVEDFDIGNSFGKHHTDIDRLKKGGVGATFFAVYVAGKYADSNTAANRAMQMIDTVRHDIVGRYPGDFVLATTAADVEAARKKGRIAALMGIEGGHAIEDSLRLLRDFHALGVRYMTLTHNNNNNWADSSGSPAKHNGLTAFGREVVREMNRLGMIVDVSHTSDKTFWDALETSKAPVFASHSSCRALCDVPRNMTDEMIAAMAKKGGVIQINFNCGFLVKTPVGGKASATLADAVSHIDHAVKVAGIGGVGIGSDFDGITCVPAGLEDVGMFPALTRALMEKGYSESDIRKIYGGNTLRLMRAVEKAASLRDQL
ncbi:MAG: membrane dipeptidase [Bryobacterales bacterium]|nr:membrane dipeptidase [Bryobacterales bacterium]